MTRGDTMKKSLRYNEGKPKLSFVLSAKPALEGAARVLEKGADKYERDNWKEHTELDVPIDSLLRHLAAFCDGEALDAETGLPHVDHILCNALFLSYHYHKTVE